MLSTAVGGLVGGQVAMAAGTKRLPPGKYVDIHVHVTQAWAKQPALTTDLLLRWMDQRQVAQAVVLPLVSPEGWYYAVSNDVVLDQTRPHRDRLIPFCDIDPRNEYIKGKAIRPMLERYLAAGAKGLGEHKCGGAIDAPRNLDIFRVCSDLKLPVLLHMDTVRNIDQPGLPGLERVLQAAPQAMFIGHATSFWSSISGDATAKDFKGYPKRPVTPGGALDRLMEKYPNLYGDLSAGSGLNALRRDPKFGREFLIRRADRLLFGTDYLADGQVVEQFEFLDQLQLPAAVQAKIFRDNARRIVGLG
jgi:predicted TIM-barrel fold metal-dependent hydrolase